MVEHAQFDFLSELERCREATIAEIIKQGGVELRTLEDPEHGNRGNGIDFFRLEGVTTNETALGFKRYRASSLVGYYSTIFANEHSGFTLDIATMRLMGLHSPNWASMLPAVHLEVLDDNGEPLGILTEDFSEHGRLRCSGSTWLNTYPKLFDKPDAVDSDHLDNVVGIFENYRKDPVVVKNRKIMDVYPLYNPGDIYDEHGEYADWFAERLDLSNVASRIDGCRIRASELVV